MRSHVMSPTSRALRVGVLLGDNLVEERVLRPVAPVTFGQSLRCTLSVPADGAPLEHTLFAVEQGRFLLRITAAMTGRLVQNGAELELDPGTTSIPIEQGARGKLRIGDATVLFQEIAAPAIAPRPRLPASVRGSLADRIDRRLGVIVGASIVVHLGIASWAWITERETDSMAEDIAMKYEAPTYEVMELPDFAPPIAPAEPDADPGPGVATPAKPDVQTPTTKPRPVTDRLPEPVDANAWAQMITGNDPGKTGQNELPNRIPNVDLDKQIKNVTDSSRTPTDPTRTPRDPGLRLGDGRPGPTFEDPTMHRPPPKEEQQPIARITPVPQPKPPGKDPLSINLVLGRIQGAYMAGLQRCYVKHGLSTDASLVAKVTISFVVDPTGVATDNQARGANAEVDDCIRNQMTTWRFPIPKDEDGDPTDAPFKLQLALQPS